MKLFIAFIALAFVAAALSQSCKDTMECGNKCPDGYHSQCVDMLCKCPAHSCSAASDCPQGNGQGCPPFCKTTCENSVCRCNWSKSNQSS